MINEPVKDEEAQFNLVEDERAMCMIGRDPNPPFRLLRVPGDSFVKAKQQTIMDGVPGLPSKKNHGWCTWAAKHLLVSASRQQAGREPPQTAVHCREAQPFEA